MTQSSRPWDGSTAGDQGPYSDKDWRHVWQSAANGIYANEGVLRKGNVTSPLTGLAVTAGAGLSVDISAGYAFPVGWYYNNDATVNLTLVGNNTGLPRIDLIVLRATWGATQEVRLARKTGIPASSPIAPGLIQIDGTTYEIPLAEVTVGSGATSIASDDILYARRFVAQDAFYSRAISAPNFKGIVPFFEAWTDGTPLACSPSAGYASATQALNNSSTIAGYSNAGDRLLGVSSAPVGQTDIHVGIVSHGLARVVLRDSVSAGDELSVQDNIPPGDGINTGCEVGNYYQLGTALESGVADDKVLCHVNADVGASMKPRFIVEQQYAQNTAGPALTALTWVARVFNIEILNKLAGANLDTASNLLRIYPGTYQVSWWAIADSIGVHQTRLRDTASGTTLVQGTSCLSVQANNQATISRGMGVFTITGSFTTLQLQHYVSATNANGQGRAANLGTEVYAHLELTKIGGF